MNTDKIYKGALYTANHKKMDLLVHPCLFDMFIIPNMSLNNKYGVSVYYDRWIPFGKILFIDRYE